MYDPFARGLIEYLPDLEGLTSDGARRALSRVYFTLTNLRLRGTREVSDSLAADILFLRRLANTLESRAIFDVGVESGEQRASAFVAAEALSLLADLRQETFGTSSGTAARIEREEIFSRVEAALLYIIAGYDANAGGVIRNVPENHSQPDGDIYSRAQFEASEWALDVLISLCTFHLNPLPSVICPVDFAYERPGSLVNLERDVRGRLYGKLGEAIRSYMGWLTGDLIEGLATARSGLTQIAQRLAAAQHPTYADIHHLARLLLAVLENTEGRALVHVVPPPNPGGDDVYLTYLRARAKGLRQGSGRPLLWPSVQKYVEECLPGPNRHAVVSMPTGSGKSFLAELAASQALQSGWTLYLVPTNSLAHQTRRDLARDLDTLNVKVRAFIGDGEYTMLEQERVKQVPPRTVAVMTPEKCSLAMRLNPEAFQTCNLCVFDECHLIGEQSRGIIAELVLSQLMALAPDCRFLLMSAIVQNPDSLAKWLQEATGGESVPITLDWRPTRSLRGAVGVDVETVRKERPLAKQRLASKSNRFKNEKFEANFALLVGLQGAWQADDDLDYAFTRSPAKALLQVHREPLGKEWDWRVEGVSWVNESGRRLSKMLAEARIPTILFLPRNKHYPFSVATKLILSEVLLDELEERSERVRALLVLAEDELGLESEVGHLIERGLSVHTAALLETEKFASEEAFRDHTTMVMLATGTLAQGLNLPAIAVIIGGTEIGYTPQEAPEVIEQRRLSQLLNASGRAGRAGFANQGLVLAIPNRVLFLDGPGAASTVSDEVSFLARTDASINILSPLQSFLDSIAKGQFDPKQASSNQLVAAAMLVDGTPETPQVAEILHRTYAAYLRRQGGLDEGVEIGTARLAQVRAEFVAEFSSPEWLPIAAQKAGLNFFTALRLLQVLRRVMPQLPSNIFRWDIQAWVTILFETLQYLTPQQVGHVFELNSLEKFVPNIHEVTVEPPTNEADDPDWTPPEQWTQEWQRLEALVKLWMDGKSIKEIAALLLYQDVNDIPGKRNRGSAPIPKTLGFVKEIIERLAILAGGIVAIVEEDLRERVRRGEDWPSKPPFELSTLPLALRYGCNSPQTLAWYRFGPRLRRPAHLLEWAFPLSSTLQDDNLLREAVRDVRRSWLRGQIRVPLPLLDEYGPVYDAIKTVLRSQY